MSEIAVVGLDFVLGVAGVAAARHIVRHNTTDILVPQPCFALILLAPEELHMPLTFHHTLSVECPRTVKVMPTHLISPHNHERWRLPEVHEGLRKEMKLPPRYLRRVLRR